MTFQQQTWMDDDTDALDATCTIETGTVLAPTAYTSIPCLSIPPTNEEKDITLQLLIKDTAGVVAIGGRVVYAGDRYVISRISRDGDYVRVVSTDWPESA